MLGLWTLAGKQEGLAYADDLAHLLFPFTASKNEKKLYSLNGVSEFGKQKLRFYKLTKIRKSQ